MKKLLFVYYLFPPFVGGWRAIGSIVRYLPELGWQPVVLSAADTVRYDKDYSSLEKVLADVQVHRVGHRERPRKLQSALNKLHINLDFPDSFKGWYAPALQEGRRILSREKVDLIFSYGPPHTCHFVAMQLKKEFNIPWVVGLADLWSGNSFLIQQTIHPLRALQERQIKQGEQTLLQAADSVIVRCWEQRQQLCALHNKSEDQIQVINHGYDEADYRDLRPYTLYPDKLTITHLGSFYAQYQEPFLKFLEAVNEGATDSEIVLVGRGVTLPRTDCENLTRILYVPQRKALALGLGSDFLLAIMPPSAKWTMMKLYDYLRLSKPILALVPEDGDIARIIREAQAGFVLSYEPGRMKQQLRMIFDDWRRGELKGFQPDQEYIARLERGNMTKRIVQVFNEVSS